MRLHELGKTVMYGVRRPRPPDSKPMPEEKVFALTMFSRAGVQAPT